MKTKVSPAAIGMFITGAVVIIFVSLILFGSGRLFRKTKPYLLTFREPVTGLNQGAPVKMLGASIGEVSSIWLGIENQTAAPLIHVLIQVDRSQLPESFEDSRLDLNDRARFERAIHERGFCARLETLSLLSGQLFVAIDRFPDEKGFQIDQEDEHGYWEIPTVPSAQREMLLSLRTTLENLASLDMEGISTELKGLITDLRKDLDSIEFSRLSDRLSSTLAKLDTLVADENIRIAFTNLNLTLQNTEQLTSKLNREVDPLLADVRSSLQQASTTLEEASLALSQLGAQVRPGSPLSDQLLETLERASRSLDALREFAQQLKRSPNSIVTGRAPQAPQ